MHAKERGLFSFRICTVQRFSFSNDTLVRGLSVFDSPDLLTDICGTTAVAVSGGGGGLWLSIYLGSNLDGWAIAMGAGLVMVVTVAAGIINVDIANIAAVADGKMEIFGSYGRRRTRTWTNGVPTDTCSSIPTGDQRTRNFRFPFPSFCPLSIHRRFADIMVEWKKNRSSSFFMLYFYSRW